jgi:septal ring factor EnvC (AmiA/AmiB activator)
LRPNSTIHTGRAALALAAACLLIGAAPAHTQGDLDRRIRANQLRLDSIRRQREMLEDELGRLRGQLRDITTEITNIEQQKGLTSRVVNELDRQMLSMTSQLDTATINLMLAQDALVETDAVLRRRLVEIYKRGPLWAFDVLLAAESFGDLLSRYKYLELVTRQDRALVSAIENLRDRITVQRREQLAAQNAIAEQRRQRGQELQRFEILERQRQNALRQTRASQQAAVSRVDSLSATEAALGNLLTALEEERRRAIARGARTDIAGSITEADLGTLQWPVDGPVLYSFGRAPGPDGTSIRYEGVGIGAQLGTPVRAVATGYVEHADLLGTWGPSIILDHGNNFRTLYLYLSRFDVAEGTTVVAGQVIGRSGGARSDAGPHVEFQIRQSVAGRPLALDPENWLVKKP